MLRGHSRYLLMLKSTKGTYDLWHNHYRINIWMYMYKYITSLGINNPRALAKGLPIKEMDRCIYQNWNLY